MASVKEHKAIWGLVGATVGSFILTIGAGDRPSGTSISVDASYATFKPGTAYMAPGGRIEVRSTKGPGLRVAKGVSGYEDVGDRVTLIAAPDCEGAARTLSVPISMNWRHPLAGLPAAQIIRARERYDSGRSGPERMHTVLFTHHGGLPVLSLSMSPGALFDPDTGIMVVGNGILHAPEKVLTAEYRDPRWWKYPGNFHMRGKAWERQGTMQLIDTDGSELFQSQVSVRINGQMTRSFPQHALRLAFPKPLVHDLFGEPVRDGYHAVVLRAAGNDQIKAMLRDAFQHGLCAGLPFDVSGHRTCVVYINGAYWGVHHIRHRMDEDELARRYGIASKDITILEDEARLYAGDTMQVVHFENIAAKTAKWDGKGTEWMDSLDAQIDVDGFLAYMATQMILGNMDWPSQNVKFWRYSGELRSERPLDGRWYFVMGDSDLGFGVHASASTDMFIRANALDVPITRIFRGMMRNHSYKLRFLSTARDLARGAFSAHRASQHLERIVQLMEPEMDRHTARWRRPADKRTWMGNVDVLRVFAREREAEVLRQLDDFERRQN